MKTRTTAIACTALALMLLVLPTAVAKHTVPGSDDDLHGDISRMFPSMVVARMEFKGNGIGIYDPFTLDQCIIRAMGFQAPLGGIFYYETGRVIVNTWKHLFEDTTSIALPVPCPDPAAPPTSYHIVYHGININSGFYLPQEAILCEKKPFDACIPTDWDWDVYACKPKHTFFGHGFKPGGIFLVDGVSVPLGSHEIWCDGGTGLKDLGPDAAFHRHDVTEKIDANDTGPGFVSSGFDGVPVDVIAHEGNGDAYVISCLTVSKVQIPPPPALPFNVETTSHDWVLVLDRATVVQPPVPAGWSWAHSLAYHFGGGGVIGGLNNNHGNDLQGFFDLSGQNGCPLDNTECPQEDKKPGGLKDGLKTDKDDACGSNDKTGIPAPIKS